ncbi:MAG: site-2 protease family protein [Parcubacteria group bacterium]|nr:site-2 protease family protein [Parcubacteria group bacterium]
MSIIIFIIVLALLILVHELGHFLIAKKAGVKVPEFGLGFPPKIFGIKKGETEYTLNWIPFGGFVKIVGENADEEIAPEDRQRSLTAKPRHVQAAIIAAGVTFNFLFAWIIFSIGFMVGLPASVETTPLSAFATAPELTITSVLDGSPAEKAGLKTGDIILALTSKEDALQNASNANDAQTFISAYGETEGEIGFLYKRGNSDATFVSVVPETGIIPDKPAVGITMDVVGIARFNPLRALWEGASVTGFLIGNVAMGFFGFIKSVFIGAANVKDIAGPVGIAGLVGQAEALGFTHLMMFVAFISVNLGVINLIPFPALDGGRLFFLAIEAIKRSPINPRVSALLNTIGFALLLILMLVVTYNDIARIING